MRGWVLMVMLLAVSSVAAQSLYCDAEGFAHEEYPWRIPGTQWFSSANLLTYDLLWERGMLQSSCLGAAPAFEAIGRVDDERGAPVTRPQSLGAPLPFDPSPYEELLRERIRIQEGGFRSLPEPDDPRPSRVSSSVPTSPSPDPEPPEQEGRAAGQPAQEAAEVVVRQEQPSAQPSEEPEASEEPTVEVEKRATEEDPPTSEEPTPEESPSDATRAHLEERIEHFSGEKFAKQRAKFEKRLEKLG